MPPANPTAPEISFIVMAQDRFEPARRLVRALRKQTARDRTEVVIVCPSRERLGLEASEVEGFASVKVVELGGPLTSTSAARAAGIRAASAGVVALAEDHCFQAKDWAERIIERHREDWAGVGPAFCNANPGSAVSWANFLIEYGDFADPAAGGERSLIPGHNSAYKRAPLLEYGDRLPQILEAEAALQWDLASRGHRFCLEPAAKSFHVNFSLLGCSAALRLHGGRLFAANRARSWPLFKRAAFALGSPLIPLVRFSRVVRQARRLRVTRPLALVFPTALMLLILDGVGEMLGYAIGEGDTMAKLSDWGEFNREQFLRKQDRWTPNQDALPTIA